MSKLSEFFEKEKIDPRRVVAVSKRVEGKKTPDRQIHLARRSIKGGQASEAQKALAETKPRSGKSVSRPLLDRAMRGERVPGAAKTRIARAVSKVLETKKKDAVTARDLF
jgi:ribosomal protein L22